jgi:serine protease
MVGGCAAAATNNGVGIAGVGYNARLLFTKHYADDQPSDDRFYTSNLYLGILYAAEVLSDNNIDKKIINCSFGGIGRSQVIQDFINLVTLDFNCLVIAAAGNDNKQDLHYPAAYNNVLSVASTDSGDRRSSFSNFGTWVDISAPGSSIFTTSFDNTYSSENGTSFSCPITSGAAAIVWSHFPELTGIQVAEKLRVTADESFYSLNIASLKNKLGKGRLDIFKALTVDFPSLRASKIKVQNENGSSAVRSSQTGFLSFDVFNHLSSTTSNVEISISSSSSLVTFTTSKVYPGLIGEGSTISTKQNPFVFTTAANIPSNTKVNFTISYIDGEYHDYEVVSVTLNPSYIDLEENQVSTTVSSIGRLGYDGEGQTSGLGFQFNGTPLLYEMGLIMGNSSANILNNVRAAASSAYDQDFVQINQIDQIIPGERSATEIFGSMSNSATLASQNILIDYRSLVWKDAPNDQFVIVEYKLTNPTANPISNYHFGIFADWDITIEDSVNWNETLSLGYVFPKADDSSPLAGIQVLEGTGHQYAIDNNQDTPEASFGLYDGYTDVEKFTSISTSRNTSGLSVDSVSDVSHVVSSGPHTINPGETITIAFALHAADDLASLIASAAAADTLYNLTLQAPTPVVVAVDACYGGTANISATGATSFNWYHNFTDGEPFFSGSQLVTGDLFNDTIFYVSNADNSFESVRTPAIVNLKANPQVITSGPTTFCDGEVITLSALEADEYEWSTSATTQSIEISTEGDYSLIVRDLDLDCESTSEVISVTILPLPVAAFTSDTESITNTSVNFSDESTDGVSWLWNFGDGSTSTDQNPVHQYVVAGDYQITLTVTSANGCQHEVTNGIGIITSSEKELEAAVSVYPNPANDKILVEASGLSSPSFTIDVMSIQGRKLFETTVDAVDGKISQVISTASVPAGLYLVKVSNDGKSVTKKLIKH